MGINLRLMGHIASILCDESVPPRRGDYASWEEPQTHRRIRDSRPCSVEQQDVVAAPTDVGVDSAKLRIPGHVQRVAMVPDPNASFQLNCTTLYLVHNRSAPQPNSTQRRTIAVDARW
jgi:hypothetical protein